MASKVQIKCKIVGRAGVIIIDLPEALNDITFELCMAIRDQLRSWRKNEVVALVIIEDAGDKAFIAGSDVEELYRAG